MSRGWIAGVLWGVLLCSDAQTAWAQASFGIGSRQRLEAETEIRQRLRSTVTFRFHETPLAEVLQRIREHCQINLLVNEKMLEDMGVDQRVPVSIEMHNVSVEAFLNTILPNLNLTWLIQDEALVITTPDHAQSRLNTRIYPVADLVFPPGSRSVIDADYDTLIEIITSTIAPDTWEDVGGPGAIEPDPNTVALVISQTDGVHHPVEDLLTALRGVRRVQGLPRFPIGAASLAQPSARAIRQPVVRQPNSRRYAAAAQQDWRMPRLHD